MTTDKSILRMNLTAVKKVDPYANDIIDSSSHVAFYTFNADKNEWEKTDVEGAFFIFTRSAEPRHSIFINNRLNTMSFVEPITGQLELQSQPPFLLYRNERSRIRGFWFYNSQECQRISKLVAEIVQTAKNAQIKDDDDDEKTLSAGQQADGTENDAQGGNLDIFKMLSKAQQDYNSQQVNKTNNTVPIPATADNNNVMKFFAAAKPTTANESNMFQRVLPNTLSVEQLEKQQRVRSPLDVATIQQQQLQQQQRPLSQCMMNVQQLNAALAECQLSSNNYLNNSNDENSQLTNFMNAAAANLKTNKGNMYNRSSSVSSDLKKTLLQTMSTNDTTSLLLNATSSTATSAIHLSSNNIANTGTPTKPSLMLPTMFEKSSSESKALIISHNANNNCGGKLIKPEQQQLTLNPTQLVQAFNYLLQNDDEFVLKLHEAYIKTVSKTLLEHYQ